MGHVLPFDIRPQPDDTTCGPTCLHGVYRFFGYEAQLDEVIREVPALELGGTLAVHLANHALVRGFDVTLVTWNLRLFDPTWFRTPEVIPDKLRAQREVKNDPKLRDATDAYLEFLARGGRVVFEDLTPQLLRRWLQRGIPLLAGLSATFLYRSPREHDDLTVDDVGGDPVGHFVLLTGYLSGLREVVVTDPLYPNPLAETHTYPLPIERVVGSIFLGALTHDANLLIIRPNLLKRSQRAHSRRSE